MTRFCVIVAVLALLAGTAGAARAPQAGASRGKPAYSSTATATAVLVDVVVRDKKGRPVTDLTADDFAVAEDGVGQKVDSFTRVSHGSGIGVGVAWRPANKTLAVMPTTPPPSPADTTSTVEDATTAIVFDHLSTESLRLAQKATLDYVPMSGESGVRVGVFATDPGVRMLQSYTTDRTLVRRAIQNVVPSGVTAEEQKEERNDDLIARRRDLQSENQSAAQGAASLSGAALARNSQEIGSRESELVMIQTELNMIRSFDNMERAHKGYDTSMALFAVIRTLSLFPGRKTIVFFSEGLPVSPNLSARFESLIDAANRANVTAYAVDANGLRAKSTLTTTRKEMETFAEERMAQVASGTNRSDQPLSMGFERVQDTLKLDSRGGLARLAQETGGFLVEQSNDLASAFRRIDEDNQFHYLLTYSPKNTTFDGKFRSIQVKVHRAGMQVFARKGYRALHATGGIDAGSYETPALALLDQKPLPNAFPIQAAGYSFPAPQRPGLTPVLVRVGTDALRFNVDRQRSTYSAQAAIVVRFRDGKGQEVQTLGQQYVLSGEAKDLEAAKRGEILFYREADFAPGVYTMETIVMDVVANQGSARIATLNVGTPGDAPFEMSSLVLVSRAEDVTASQAVPDAPLYVGQTLLYPNLGAPIKKSASAELPFYFTLYGNLANVKVDAQLLRNGQAVAEAPVPLTPARGARLQHVGRLPLGSLASGTYELRIRASDSTHETSRTAFFTLQE
jgi:VWFA-related protein